MLQGGIIRVKRRSERRSGLKIEPPWRFYPKLAVEFVWKYSRLANYYWRFARLRRRIENDPGKLAYTDPAMAPSVENEVETLQMFTHTADARAAVKHQRRVAELTRAR